MQKILKDYVEKNPNDSRWVFYLAQSYRDAGGEDNYKNALYWYEKRTSMITGYWEEVYFSYLMIASIKSALNYPIYEVLESYRKCTKLNRNRIEHIIPIVLYYQSNKDYDSSYIYTLYAMQMAGKLPKTSSLFISVDDYLWKIYELHGMSCWYTNRQEEAMKCFKKIMEMCR